MNNRHFIISRKDNIGDVIYTLPMAGLLKEKFPNCKVSFLTRNYTKDIIEMAEYVDGFISLDHVRDLPKNQAIKFINEQHATDFIHVMPDKELAYIIKKTNIKNRVGTIRRPYHIITCNKHIWASRRHNDRHEMQLCARMLSPYNTKYKRSAEELAEFIKLTPKSVCPQNILDEIDKNKFSIILHPGSHGHGNEWPASHFQKLIEKLDKNKFQVFISGTQKEYDRFYETLIKPYPDVIDLTRRLKLGEFCDFIKHADCLIASSTGPLHISSRLGIKTIGLFPGYNTTRWRPFGPQTAILEADKICSACQSHKKPGAGVSGELCQCMHYVTVDKVFGKIDEWQNKQPSKL